MIVRDILPGINFILLAAIISFCSGCSLISISHINSGGGNAPVTLSFKYSVTYNPNGVLTSGGVPVDADLYLQGAAVTVYSNTGNMVMAGYNFAGWVTSPSGQGTSFDNTGTASFLITSNVTLYAVWVPASGNFTSSGNTITITGPDSYSGDLNIPPGVTAIAPGSFNNDTTISSINVPSSVKTIGTGAFSNCFSITNIILNPGLTDIGNGSFNNCQDIKMVVIPSSVISIGDEAFEECYNLTNITINNGVENIGNNAFNNCQVITNITLPASITNISSQAFNCCWGLSTVYILASIPPSLGPEAFTNTGMITGLIHVNNSGLEPVYQSAWYANDGNLPLGNFTTP